MLFLSSLGSIYTVSVTDTSAFTVANPTNAPSSAGQPITIRLRYSAVGAMGAVTWDTDYFLSAWVNPLTGFSRSITFARIGTKWIEISRTTVDVPN